MKQFVNIQRKDIPLTIVLVKMVIRVVVLREAFGKTDFAPVNRAMESPRPRVISLFSNEVNSRQPSHCLFPANTHWGVGGISAAGIP
jgi:hypothetical protein